jgi:hypothetical protein
MALVKLIVNAPVDGDAPIDRHNVRVRGVLPPMKPTRSSTFSHVNPHPVTLEGASPPDEPRDDAIATSTSRLDPGVMLPVLYDDAFASSKLASSNACPTGTG